MYDMNDMNDMIAYAHANHPDGDGDDLSRIMDEKVDGSWSMDHGDAN